MQYRDIASALLRGISRQQNGGGMCVSSYPAEEWHRHRNSGNEAAPQTISTPKGVELDATPHPTDDDERINALIVTLKAGWAAALAVQDSVRADGAEANAARRAQAEQQPHRSRPPITLQIANTVYHITAPPTAPYLGEAVLQDRIVLISGGAQGLGRGLAKALVGRGALVYIADLNHPAAEQTAEDICTQYNRPRAARALQLDCADEQSVRRCTELLLREVGGVDTLICNAGILISGALERLSATEFAKVTAVNYHGYFLLAKHCSPAMRYQGRANRSCYSDIIQINSKSGLVGSLRNSAYAGSKFGGIGLTQSFAYELVEDNIKVNSICPGNLYDGPLWSDPERGLFVQYLAAGKVPGAQSIADVRKAYEAKTPMNRGCTIADVVKGVVYLIDQTFETGQALPISGGQVMLN